ncbi:TetR/AcrR family transcriptional regulator C-terminal domain-containing protein [Lentzea sp. BCCO 10_0856]|uniref:TetR/AcrR family transcriptional regulator C-terminal domain-containing protein n=1 Tax=Lentzea miocenica TaxID=3095431 RepID=A0ABU4TC34_9PSEU|nr:TetR/AcrR family transcriptional regulator C-terminal domain-containing protein [Lentzea sp. BCCO 10_0856]MDX8035453.1 TetR/AcrR family transcriptional regulator C-terminal domain-containing protein [Lentzea sp. BCCO 10_0856]
MVVYAGQGDPRRSIELLWRGPVTEKRSGPKPGLSVDAIVDAGIAVADEQGMAFSMRAVGERLGRTAMALYTYVPGKNELVDLMYDRTMAELPTSYDLSDGWRAAVTRWAQDMWECYIRHPWVLQVSQARPVLGPHEFAVTEALAAILVSTGLPGRELRGIVGAINYFVRGAAQTVAEARAAGGATGEADEEWWYARSAVLVEIEPDLEKKFPMLHLLENDREPIDPELPYLENDAVENFRSGLRVLLNGVEGAVAKL